MPFGLEANDSRKPAAGPAKGHERGGSERAPKEPWDLGPGTIATIAGRDDVAVGGSANVAGRGDFAVGRRDEGRGLMKSR